MLFSTALGDYLVIRCVVRYELAYVDWCDEALAALNAQGRIKILWDYTDRVTFLEESSGSLQLCNNKNLRKSPNRIMILPTSESANGVIHFHLLVFFIAESGKLEN
ncbi:hypothetical protein ACO0LD_07365 [Undibacterium sp. Ji83W]|uniref:hypothetical protein n=1 Tax=Undibacterium sp. Ji83W TaxID=3413043 RepID=UPI003BF13F72